MVVDIAEGSDGNTQDSPADYLVVQLHNLRNDPDAVPLDHELAHQCIDLCAGDEFPARLCVGNGVRQRHSQHSSHPLRWPDCPVQSDNAAWRSPSIHLWQHPRRGFHRAGHNESGIADEQLDGAG